MKSKKAEAIMEYEKAETQEAKYAAYEKWNRLDNLEYWCLLTDGLTAICKSSRSSATTSGIIKGS